MTIDEALTKIKQYREGLQEMYDSGMKRKYYTLVTKKGTHGKVGHIGDQETALSDSEKIKILREMEKIDEHISFIENLTK